MINCVAIDDEPLALEVLKKYISKLPNLQLLMTFSDAIDALAYLQKNQVDLLFLDIQMPDINGFQLYKDLTDKPMVIFTTAYKEFAVEGFEVDAIDYLLKPFNLARFEKAVAKAISREIRKEKEEVPSQYLYIHADYKMVKIPFADIIYMEALDDYVKVVTGTQSYLTLISMKKILEKLPKKQFIRIHRSYIVAIDKITFLQYRKIGLANNLELPVGDTYRTEIASLKRQE
ncbi:MAG: two component transcriptional regulator, LytTR family [Ferruginibacter sp.]|uniref:LytR/AlgR family response regulator transcription factor n=1 Tax=Ferruginibacter sp. TaxID=1940288 RepID=UPI00265A76A5|nr:LytTR family DNA-binding domain-containing protein [Ferruginibacter sp.]MDB5280257.1 two component transcriptional regulator, LytTR family [Ferruginibacter sp.]